MKHEQVPEHLRYFRGKGRPKYAICDEKFTEKTKEVLRYAFKRSDAMQSSSRVTGGRRRYFLRVREGGQWTIALNAFKCEVWLQSIGYWREMEMELAESKRITLEHERFLSNKRIVPYGGLNAA